MSRSKDTDSARQGRKGTPVLIVLIAALVICIVGFVAFGASGWFDSEPNLSNRNQSDEMAEPVTRPSNEADDDATVVSPDSPETPQSPQ